MALSSEKASTVKGKGSKLFALGVDLFSGGFGVQESK